MFNRADKIIAKMEQKRKEKGEADDDDNEGGEDVQIEGLGDEAAAMPHAASVDSESEGSDDD